MRHGRTRGVPAVAFRVSADQRAQIESAAGADGRSVNDWARDQTLSAAVLHRLSTLADAIEPAEDRTRQRSERAQFRPSDIEILRAEAVRRLEAKLALIFAPRTGAA